MHLGKSKIGFYLLVLFSIIYGIVVSYLSTVGVKKPSNVVDISSYIRSYQNFAIVVGVIVGFITCLVAYIAYKFTARSRRGKTLFVMGGSAGAIIGFVGPFIVCISADSFGLIRSSIAIIVTDSIVPTFVGIILGLGIAYYLWLHQN
jgi:heme/copper-type cytochrome/quinol oxidase subunit 2